MDARAFVKLVSDMMATQADYWRDRKQSDLIKSKDLEKQVRKALRDGISFPDPTPAQEGEDVEQTSLFGE